jgi:hypothetical protein
VQAGLRCGHAAIEQNGRQFQRRLEVVRIARHQSAQQRHRGPVLIRALADLIEHPQRVGHARSHIQDVQTQALGRGSVTGCECFAGASDEPVDLAKSRRRRGVTHVELATATASETAAARAQGLLIFHDALPGGRGDGPLMVNRSIAVRGFVRGVRVLQLHNCAAAMKLIKRGFGLRIARMRGATQPGFAFAGVCRRSGASYHCEPELELGAAMTLCGGAPIIIDRLGLVAPHAQSVRAGDAAQIQGCGHTRLGRPVQTCHGPTLRVLIRGFARQRERMAQQPLRAPGRG